MSAPKYAAGWEIKIRLKIRFIIVYVLVTVSATVALTYLYSRANADLRQIIGYGSSLFGASVAVCALLYNAENLRISNREKQLSSAAKFIERWNNPSYYVLKEKWRA
jgi:hypothetical protein